MLFFFFDSGTIFPKKNISYFVISSGNLDKQSLKYSVALTAKRAGNKNTVYVNLKNFQKERKILTSCSTGNTNFSNFNYLRSVLNFC